jgi:hypothetical protein
MTPETTALTPYEQRLDRDWEFAMDEGDRFFQQESAVFKALRALARRLDELGIPYAVVGAMALNAHGFRRFTDDVDLLVTPAGLKAIHEHLEGRGYVPPFQGSKQLRDTEHGVRVGFLVTGGYPGDAKVKPVSFPDPTESAVKVGPISVISLPALLTLKLASGMTNPGRMKDLADVQEVIRTLNLTREFAEQLHAYVQAKFAELWDGLRASEWSPEKE